MQHRRHHPRILLLHPASHVPRLALRARRRNRYRHRCQALPIAASLPDRSGTCLHRLDLRARLRSMAAHRISRRIDDRARLRQWIGQVRCWYRSDDLGLVRLLATHHRDDWSAGDVAEYERAGQVDWRLNGRMSVDS